MQQLMPGGNVLISLFNGYGDAFLALPVMRALQRRFTGADIYLACRSEQFDPLFGMLGVHHVANMPEDTEHCRVLLAHMGLTHFISFNAYYPCSFDQQVRTSLADVVAWGFCDEWGIPLLPASLQRKHMRDQYYHVVGWEPEYTLSDRQPDVRPSEEQRLRAFLESGIPGSSGAWYALHLDTEPEKMWPIDRWCALVHAIWLRWGAWPLVIGLDSEDTRELVAQCPFARRLPPDERIAPALAAVKAAGAFIGVDSIFAHVADSYHKPLIVLFGASDSVVWGPRGPRAAIIAAEAGGMRRIATKDVLEAVNRLDDEYRAEIGRTGAIDA